uniref:Uncharacterized protein n=1 Tax=Romanomermis culicivorax TaxID=13658 RepID=A0A915I722_ROMCU
MYKMTKTLRHDQQNGNMDHIYCMTNCLTSSGETVGKILQDSLSGSPFSCTSGAAELMWLVDCDDVKTIGRGGVDVIMRETYGDASVIGDRPMPSVTLADASALADGKFLTIGPSLIKIKY